ncbi:SRPBCC domain-containing protein [Natronogracilivirga saccharolytica]|uniref:SRPBCC domain-containing protein n=1 Tax=Natronogracilivirga saccharolytica TaxID=2812953 RepID=UPI003AF5EEE8
MRPVFFEVTNGRCFERGPHGFECDWGRVLAFDPPSRIVFTWQIAPDRVPEPNPQKASEIEVLFVEKGRTETQMKIEHRNFDKHGEYAESYKQALRSPQGWHYILKNYLESIS